MSLLKATKRHKSPTQSSLSLFIGLVILIGACSSEPEPTSGADEDAVRDTFSRFLGAIERHDAEMAAQLVQRTAFGELESLYGQALQETPLQLDSLRPFERYYIVAFRHWLSGSPTQPVFSGADAFILTVSEEIVLAFLSETTLASVTVTGDDARAECRFRGQNTPAVFSFVRSDNGWRWDMTSLNPLIDHTLTTLAQASDSDIEEAIFQVVEENTQRPVDRSILGTPSPDPGESIATEQGTNVGSGVDSTAGDVVRDVQLAEARDRVREASFFGAITTADDGDGPAMDLVFNVSDRNAETILDRVYERSLLDGSNIDSSDVEIVLNDTFLEEIEPTEIREIASEANISSGAAEIGGDGTIDEESLTDDLRRHGRDIRRCYERALPDEPELGGRIVLEFDIDDRGRTSDVSLGENEVGTGVGDCITGRVRRWRFDEPEGGTVTVSKTYILAPGE